MTAEVVAPLVGLVLAGGYSRRMGQDKGQLEVSGATQVERCVLLLEQCTSTVLVSIRAAQAALEPYRRLRTVLDAEIDAGPAAGLLAAWGQVPGAALLVLAVDMPLVDSDLLAGLIAKRDPFKVATAFRRKNGLFEPLCAIWEPQGAPMLRRQLGQGSSSLRRFLEGQDVCALESTEPGRLISANTARSFERLIGMATPGRRDSLHHGSEGRRGSDSNSNKNK